VVRCPATTRKALNAGGEPVRGMMLYEQAGRQPTSRICSKRGVVQNLVDFDRSAIRFIVALAGDLIRHNPVDGDLLQLVMVRKRLAACSSRSSVRRTSIVWTCVSTARQLPATRWLRPSSRRAPAPTPRVVRRHRHTPEVYIQCYRPLAIYADADRYDHNNTTVPRPWLTYSRG
jgi:hypothetical protein